MGSLIQAAFVIIIVTVLGWWERAGMIALPMGWDVGLLVVGIALVAINWWISGVSVQAGKVILRLSWLSRPREIVISDIKSVKSQPVRRGVILGYEASDSRVVFLLTSGDQVVLPSLPGRLVEQLVKAVRNEA